MAKPVVLIVEDEELIRMVVVEVFMSRGFVVLEAECAAAALLVHGENAVVDLLFTDVNMPGEMNGIDLAEHLKRNDPTLKVMITSALPILRPVEHLPAMFLTKPYNMDAACDAAHGMLAA